MCFNLKFNYLIYVTHTRGSYLLLGLADPWQVVVVGSGRVKEMEGEEQLPALVLLTSAIMNCVSAAILGRPRSQV